MFQKLKSWLILLALLVAGPVLVVGSLKDGRDFKRLQAEGRETMAAVESVEWSKKRGIERGFKAHVVFKTENGDEVRGQVSLSKEFGQALKEEKALPVVKVRYLPSDPHVVHTADATDSSTAMLLTGFVLFAIGAGWLWWKLRSRKTAVAAEEPATA
jgi:Protein of unknown function (DUF3592)